MIRNFYILIGPVMSFLSIRASDCGGRGGGNIHGTYLAVAADHGLI